MKVISIEDMVYRIRDDDYENLKYAIHNFSGDIVTRERKINNILSNICENYKPVLKLVDSFNYR